MCKSTKKQSLAYWVFWGAVTFSLAGECQRLEEYNASVFGSSCGHGHSMPLRDFGTHLPDSTVSKPCIFIGVRTTNTLHSLLHHTVRRITKHWHTLTLRCFWGEAVSRRHCRTTKMWMFRVFKLHLYCRLDNAGSSQNDQEKEDYRIYRIR